MPAGSWRSTSRESSSRRTLPGAVVPFDRSSRRWPAGPRSGCSSCSDCWVTIRTTGRRQYRLGVTALLLVVARPLACALTPPWFDLRTRGIAGVSWLGMRGAVPIVLATLVLSAGIAEAQLIFDLVFFVVLASALLQGTTAIPLLRLLRLNEEPSPTRSIAEALPLDEAEVDLIEITLTHSSPLAGMELRSADPPDNVLVVALVRGDQVRLPRGSTRLLAEDRLLLTTTDRSTGRVEVQDWVHGHRDSSRER